jgi:hypothetical protein
MLTRFSQIARAMRSRGAAVFAVVYLGLVGQIIGLVGCSKKQAPPTAAAHPAAAEVVVTKLYSKQPCIDLSLDTNGTPNISPIPVRNTTLGPFPYLGDVPGFTLQQRGELDKSPGSSHPDGQIGISGSYRYLQGMLGVYEYETDKNQLDNRDPAILLEHIETGLTGLGAVCIVANSGGLLDDAVTYVIRTSTGLVWFKTDKRSPKNISVLQQGKIAADQLLPRQTPFYVANSSPSVVLEARGAALSKGNSAAADVASTASPTTITSATSSALPASAAAPYVKQSCLTIPVNSVGEPDISAVPIRTTELGQFPYIDSVPKTKMDQVGHVEMTPNASGKRHRDAFFPISEGLYYLKGRFGQYQFENTGSSFGPQHFESYRESCLVDLGAICVKVGVNAQGVAKFKETQNTLMPLRHYQSMRTHVLRTPTAVIWFRTFDDTETMTGVLLQGEISAAQSAPRNRAFYVAPPLPAEPLKLHEQVSAERPVPPFNPNADFSDFQGIFVLEAYAGKSITDKSLPKLVIVRGLITFGNEKNVLPISRLGNAIAVVGPHADAEIRIVDRNTIVFLAPSGTTGNQWWRRQ